MADDPGRPASGRCSASSPISRCSRRKAGNDYSISRYQTEVKRLYELLEARLAQERLSRRRRIIRSPISRPSLGPRTQDAQASSSRTSPISRAGTTRSRRGRRCNGALARSRPSSRAARRASDETRTASSAAAATRGPDHESSVSASATRKKQGGRMRSVGAALLRRCLAAVAASSRLRAQSVADFYRGKQIRVIVGSSAGRLRHLGARGRPPYAAIRARQSEFRGREHAGRGLADRGQLPLQQGGAGRHRARLGQPQHPELRLHEASRTRISIR